MRLEDRIQVNATDIDWDFDEEVTSLPDAVEKVFTGHELAAGGCLHLDDPKTGEWTLDIDELEEFVSDWVSDEFGMCHKGLKLEWKFA